MTPLPPLFRHTSLAVALVVAFALRLGSLDAYGLSEDETAKVRAIQAYEQGNFSANAEHPMLMKLAMWGALKGRDTAADLGVAIPVETALRFPNVVAGTATIFFAGAVATLLFSPSAGAVAALLLAFDPNVIGMNRLGKEDTFLVLFFFVAVWCYERAKRIGERDVRRARLWYTAAGGAFGLMLASKYMPHLLGLYALFNVIHVQNDNGNAPRRRWYYAAMAGAFVVANFAVLLPSTWQYCLEYVRGQHLTHHGFFYAGQLYVNDTPVSAAGVPPTYYLQMIATKVPLPVLVAAAIGIVPLIRHRRERGFVWLRVLLFFQLVGYSVFAAKFQRYGLSLLVLIDILAAVGVVTAAQALVSAQWNAVARGATATATVLLVVIAPLWAAQSARPFYSTNQNSLGARLAPPATLFPEEAYDFGVREAVAEIARLAPPRAAVISDAPGAVSHYLQRAGRSDLRVLSLSKTGIGGRGDRWVIVQDGHIYFENVESIAHIRSTRTAWREYRLRDTSVLQLFHLPADAHTTRAAGGDRPPKAVGSS